MGWDTSSPQGSDFISLGAGKIREFKTAVETALQAQGSFPGADASDPKYKWTPERGTTAARPATDLVTGQLYLNTTTGTWQRYNGATWDDLTVPTIAGSDVRAYRTTSTQAIGAGLTTIVFNAETRDTLSEFSTATGIFTAAAAGRYLVTTSVRCSNVVTGTAVLIAIVKNSTTHAEKRYELNFDAAGGGAAFMTWSFDICDIVDLAASDTIKIQVSEAGAAALALTDTEKTFVSIKKLSSL